MFVLIILIGIILLFLSSRNYTYWLSRNVKCDSPIPLFGNYYKVLFGFKTDIENVNDLYKKYKTEKVVGYYRGTTPELIIRDPDIIKKILNVDFSHFHVRGAGRDPKYEPLMLNVFSTEGDRWKLLRHGLSPAFTSNKLRNMFPLILKCTDKLQAVAKILANKELGLTIEAGTKVIIPIQALQLDEKYYDNPSEFRPNRFSPESVKLRHRYVYLPFGEGPRKCIGARLGIIESLTGLVGLLQKFTVEPAPSSKKDIKSKKTAYLVQGTDDGIPIKLIPRKTENI
ncbi:PREDICTED: cytochrome P450 6B1-like [Papilio polytes]|uniref:cytochrome P450 6B1-like n=1 Tax=Papilio polytes TaxID=76194 RepID=UPI000675BBFA|nr:PREDICTED: cytochrome P450 6B1-like [Papilio polytes]